MSVLVCDVFDGWRYLGNEKSYHISAGVITTGFSIPFFKKFRKHNIFGKHPTTGGEGVCVARLPMQNIYFLKATAKARVFLDLLVNFVFVFCILL